MTDTDSVWQRLALVFGSALVVAFFSEFFFFNEGPALSLMDAIADGTVLFLLLELGVWYALAIAPFLWIVEYYRVSNPWSLFLAGTAAGFFIEGLIIPVFYFELPFSLLWVSMSWHPFISIMLSLWLLQCWLRVWSVWRLVGMNSLLGVVWGAWATWPVGSETELTGEIARYVPFETFMLFALTAGAMLLVGNLLIDRCGGSSYRLGTVERWVLLLLSGGLFLLITVSVGALALVLLAVLFVLWLGLRRSRLTSPPGRTMLSELSRPVPLSNHITVFLLPVCASLTYGLMVELDLVMGAWVLGIPLSFMGIVFFVFSFWFLYRTPVRANAG